LLPEKATLHEQKAQVLLEIGDAWGALKAATRAPHSSLFAFILEAFDIVNCVEIFSHAKIIQLDTR